MVIERTNNEVIMRVPSFVKLGDMQRIIDLMIYKEATARSQATQEDVDAIAGEAKKGWWEANRKQFISQTSY